jgi:hypothetical protein
MTFKLCQLASMLNISSFFWLKKGTWLMYYFFQRLLGTKTATFKLHLICRWSPEDFELYREGLDDSDVESA